ncbi:XisI protein [Tautonia rosea]|uniref:XisI protein n=1 Tax=Tautonia rosea TaxID=2728037 RepID=UPI001473A078|nr:XisI protein [Tautonia rosea]
MGTLDDDRQLVERILTEHASTPFSDCEITQQLVFDRERDHYMILLVGRQGDRRIHGPLVHIDLIDGKFWIQYDGIEYGIAQDLLDAGIPKDRIVLGYKSPELRPHTGFAVA